jgi:hypothetical protein
MLRTFMEKYHSENCIKYKYWKCTYLWIERLVGGDKIAWASSFLTCHRDSGRGCRGTVFRSNHHCNTTGGRSKRPSSSLESSDRMLWSRVGVEQT